MSTKINFTDQWLKSLKGDLKKDRHYGDAACKGLSLKVTMKGVRSFSFTFRLHTRTGKVTLGRYPDCSLRYARKQVETFRSMVAQGIDPRTDKTKKREESTKTVELMVQSFIELYAKPKNKSWKQAESNLRLYLVSELRDVLIKDVKRSDIHSILDSLMREGKGTAANRALAHMKKFFGWLVEREHLDHSPADHIKKPFDERERDRELKDDEIRKIWFASDELSPPQAAWVKLSILCGQRQKETASIQRSKLEDGLWFLSSNDTKNRRAHVIPLPRQAHGIINDLPQSEYIHLLCSGKSGDKPINGFSKLKEMLDQKVELEKSWRLHDLRSVAPTNMARLGFSRETIKRVINHKDIGVTRIYDRYTYLDEKREALQAWADRLDEILAQ